MRPLFWLVRLHRADDDMDAHFFAQRELAAAPFSSVNAEVSAVNGEGSLEAGELADVGDAVRAQVAHGKTRRQAAALQES